MRSSRRPPAPQSGPSSIAGTAARLAATAAAVFVLAACSARTRPIVALDEAFAETRPGLSALLQDDRTWGLGPFERLGKPVVVPIALTESPGMALDAANAERKRSGLGTVIVASPLVAKAIVEGGYWSGDPPLVVPEWRGGPVPGLRSVATDPLPAYRAAGWAAGAFIAALARGGGSPSCGLVFAEAPARPREALAAFAQAYAEASEGGPIQIRELEKDDETAEAQGTPPRPSVEGKAEAAVAELLGADMRVLFVALGRDAGAAIRAAARPGLAVGADFPYPEAPPSLAFRIVPNDAAMQKTVVSELRAPRGVSDGVAPETIPALLVAGAQASSIRAGKADLRSFVEGAALRAKGSR
jgi:hypothetical protein